MDAPEQTPARPTSTPVVRKEAVFSLLALVIILLIAGYFRFVGLMWGDYSYPHPDERFLVWVVSDIAPVHSLGEYFDTATSTLNPANRGHSFFVYGDLPVVATRYITGWLFKEVGWEQILQVGRGLSALLDLLTVLLVFKIVERLAGWKVAAAAGLLSAAAVLQIQQSHFFTSDTFSTFFTTLTIYFGVLLVTEPDSASPWNILKLSALFGLAVGLAMACKINTAPVALLLPAALFIRWLREQRALSVEERTRLALWLAVFAVISGILAGLVFRLGQPYAFSGPGFLGIKIDERWLASIRDLQAQSAGDVDFPPALQWANRNHLFSLENLVVWGLGVPLGVTAWIGFFLFALRTWERIRRATRAVAPAIQVTGEETGPAMVPYWGPAQRWYDPLLQGAWPGVLLVWLWTALYFTWQSMAWNPTMRYQLPIYPTLTILAAWGLSNLWAHPGFRLLRIRVRKPHAWRTGVTVAGVLVVLLTLAWAFAFTRIYTRTETRVAASRWIFANVPGPVNLAGDAGGKPWKLMLSIPQQTTLRPGFPYLTEFDSKQAGALVSVTLNGVHVGSTGGINGDLRARIFDPAQPDAALAFAQAPIPASGDYDRLDLFSADLPRLENGRRYGLALEIVRAGTPPTASAEGDMPVSGVTVSLTGSPALNLYSQVDTANYQAGEAGTSSTLMLPDGGTLRQIRFPNAAGGANAGQALAPGTLGILFKDTLSGEEQTGTATLQASDPAPMMRIDPSPTLKPGVPYLVTITPMQPGQQLLLDFLDNAQTQAIPALTSTVSQQNPLYLPFNRSEGGTLSAVTLAHAATVPGGPQPGNLTLQINSVNAPAAQVASASAKLSSNTGDPRGGPVTFTFDPPVTLKPGEGYTLNLAPDAGQIEVRGTAVANESTWDMGLPFRMDNYDPFGGIYRNDLNFEMYWDDNQDKLQRFLNNLDQTDYIFMSSDRQWGTTVRVSERYPLTTQFYRHLLGCPEDKDVLWCYRVAEPGMFNGDLGFTLVKTFTSYPNLGPLRVNTQFAEEAFTVYDAPKVMIFQKAADYNPAQAQAVLGGVDLSKVVHVTPKKASGFKDLLLTAKMAAVQQAGGTWAKLFPPGSLLNISPWFGLVVWYLFLLLLGVLLYPLLRLALPGLPDRGYPLARTAGLVLLAYLAWIAGSLGIPVTRLLLAVIFVLIAAVGLGLGFFQREELRAEWRERRGYFLRVEVVALVLFAIDLGIRLGNPDLWHPIFGGEKPMDFSFFNAVMKSTIFPPYDPWFAGGYINYYYYGFVLVGMPVKLLGITPSVAYNLILPALFSMVGLGAFSVGWNLYAATPLFRRKAPVDSPAEEASGEPMDDAMEPVAPAVITRGRGGAFIAGTVAVLALLILGNLGTVRMYWQGWQRMVVSEDEMNKGSITQHVTWAAEGIGKLISDPTAHLPYYLGDWYWKPSRAIEPESGSEITEFPMFTFLYADLHAHLIALPLTLLALAWALGMVLKNSSPGGGRRLSLSLAILIGALTFGALRPANTWDQYTYLTLGALALGYAQWRAEPGARVFSARWLNVLVPVIVLVGLALLLYSPFDAWFAQGYNSLTPWDGPKTNLNSYLVHWGLFLFVIITWLFDETVDWMDHTPLSGLNRLRANKEIAIILVGLLAAALLALLVRGVIISIIVVPLGLWVTVLLFRPGMPDTKRFVLFITGTALLMTLAVELVAVKGDIARMNTVFKFYYQAWTLLSLSAAASAAWLWGKLPGWNRGWRIAWSVGLGLLVFGAALFPIVAGRAKIADRMTPSAPHSLDGMAYMAYSRYTDGQTPESTFEMDLNQDYQAIHWVEQNIPGSPVIVEANTPEYRHWGTRFTIYTGLPGVVGWNWHERQQRTVTPDTWVFRRIDDVQSFYLTTDSQRAADFLKKYNVQYIIYGQIERAWYPGPGLAKFAQLDGKLWEKVYQVGSTVIYKVK